jgi:hypothetical protein
MVDDISPDANAFVQIKLAMHKMENRVEDGTLIVLKGHLVLEELLRAKLERGLKDPTQLRKSNLSFYQVLCLARGLFGDICAPGDSENPRSVWDIVEAWNTLRNRLAHRIAPTDTVQILGRIFFGSRTGLMTSSITILRSV